MMESNKTLELHCGPTTLKKVTDRWNIMILMINDQSTMASMQYAKHTPARLAHQQCICQYALAYIFLAAKNIVT